MLRSEMSERSSRALAAALRCAAGLGLVVDDPRVLRDRYNLLIHLPAAAVVVRAATATAEVRGPEWLAREVAVARFLGAAGLPVVSPTTTVAPGPHEADGFTLTLWQYVDVLDRGQVDAAAAGRGLRAIHDALAAFAPAEPPFPVLGEARELVSRQAATGRLAAADRSAFERVADRLGSAVDAAALPFQQLHGDAHLGNVLPTVGGPLWGDWEDTIAGPREWDLAAAVATGRPPMGDGDGHDADLMLAAYGDHDADALALMVDVRILQGVAWGLAVGPRSADDPRPARRLDWLRATAG